METQPKRIGIIGLGGVGGYYGGKLALAAQALPGYEVIFMMRGEAAKTVAAQGLQVITPSAAFRAHPALVADKPEEIGPLDFLLFCTKGYDLQDAAQQYSACIKPGTIVLPLLNGVENTALLQQLLPQAEVWKGCTYIVSRITAPGQITERGSFNELLFGMPGNARQHWFTDLLDAADINYTNSSNIDLVIWRKFLFICAIGTMTSYLDLSIGAILEHSEHRATLVALMKEIITLAEASGIAPGDQVLEETLAKMGSLPYETTSSLHDDFKNHKRTELEALPGYVVRAAKAKGLVVPQHEQIYNELKQRAATV